MFAYVVFLPLFSKRVFFDHIFTFKNFHIFFVRDLSHDILGEKLFGIWICIHFHFVYECLSSHFTKCTLNKTRIKIFIFLFLHRYSNAMNIKMRANWICRRWRARMSRNVCIERVFGHYKTFGCETNNKKKDLTKIKGVQ